MINKNILKILFIFVIMLVVFLVNQLQKEDNQEIKVKKMYATKKPNIKYSMWVWESTKQIESIGYDNFANKLAAANVDTVFINIEEFISIHEKKTSNSTKKLELLELEKRLNLLIGELNKKNIQVHGLAGSVEWSSKDYAYIPLLLVDYTNKYNATYNNKLSAIQFDIEFYNSEAYIQSKTDNRVKMAKEYVELVQQIKSSSNIPVGLAIPYWFYRDNKLTRTTLKGNEQTILYHIVTTLNGPNDYLALMSYRNKSEGKNGTIEIAEPNFKLAKQLNSDIKIYIGQETISTSELNVSFYGQTKKYFLRETEKIYEYFENNKNFANVAIHTYRSYWDLHD